MGNSELKKKTTTSLFWSFLDKFGEQLIYLVSGIVLLRIVDPEEFGLMGTLLIFIVVSRLLVDSGFARALLNRKTVSDEEYSSVFYFNAGLSLLLYLLLFVSAPLIATVFHEPRLNAISKVLFLSFVFYSFGIIQHTLLVKNANFRRLTKINIPALGIGAIVAVIMARNGYGVWALVAQNVVYAFLRTVFLWTASSWRPVACFNGRSLQSFFAFSNKLLLGGFIAALFNNIYPSLIAYLYPNSMHQVGYFSQANKYQDIPFGIISNTFRSVSMLILSEINRETERLKRVVDKIMKSISFLVFPIGLYMILAARPAFHFLFGAKWDAAVPYFKVLTLAGMLMPFTTILNELFVARKRADFFLGIEVAKRIVMILLIFMFFHYGIMGLAASWVAYTFITLIVSLVLSRKLIQYSFVDFLKAVWPYLAVAFVSNALGYFVSLPVSNRSLFLLISGVAVFGSYWLLCRAFKLEMTKEIEEWFSR